MKLFIFLTFIVATMATIYQSERLLDQAIDQLELELAARGEEKIYFRNDLDEVLYAKWACDRMSLTSQESTWSAGLNVALEKVEVGATLSNTEKKAWTYQYIDRNLAFNKIQPGEVDEQSPGLNCKSVYVDIWTVKSNGEVNKFMSQSSMTFGEEIRVHGTADAPKFDTSYEVCGGGKCGCHQNKCWTTCMQWSWCETTFANDVQMEAHFYRYSEAFKRYVDGGRKLSDLWTGYGADYPQVIADLLAHGFVSQELMHSPGTDYNGKDIERTGTETIQCSMDRECKPSFACAGACLLGGF